MRWIKEFEVFILCPVQVKKDVKKPEKLANDLNDYKKKNKLDLGD